MVKQTGDLERLCSLDDAKRRRLYDYVAGQRDPVTRDQASQALDIERSTAAYHLDKLVEGGLLTESFARPDGRGGPGAGRPAKHYERADTEVAVSVPSRDYQLVAELLARAIEADPHGTVRSELEKAARTHGTALADDRDPIDDLADALSDLGFEPYDDDDGVIRLRNCPFHRLARDHTELVCGMNL
ncbi:MAG: helix-turn-helix domain-containing protein, partial [Egibacteraceae bacterium]